MKKLPSMESPRLVPTTTNFTMKIITKHQKTKRETLSISKELGLTHRIPVHIVRVRTLISETFMYELEDSLNFLYRVFQTRVST